MALAIDASTVAMAWPGQTPGSATVTTASFTPAANSLLVAVAIQANGSTHPTSPTGGGLTWVSKLSLSVSAGSTVDVWMADAGSSPAAMTFAATFNSTTTASLGVVTCLVLTGAASTAGQSGATASTNNPVFTTGATLASAASTSWVIGGCSNFQTNAVPTFPAGQSATVGGKQQWQGNPGSGDSWWVQANTTVGNSNLTMNDSTPTGTDTSGIYFAMEILAAGAVSAPAPVFLPRNTLGRGVRNRGQIAAFLERVARPAGVAPVSASTAGIPAQALARTPAPAVAASVAIIAPAARALARAPAPTATVTVSVTAIPAQARARTQPSTTTAGDIATPVSAQVRARTSAPTVSATAAITATSAAARARTKSPTTATTSSATPMSAQARIRTATPAVSATVSVTAVPAQARARSRPETVTAGPGAVSPGARTIARTPTPTVSVTASIAAPAAGSRTRSQPPVAATIRDVAITTTAARARVIAVSPLVGSTSTPVTAEIALVVYERTASLKVAEIAEPAATVESVAAPEVAETVEPTGTAESVANLPIS